jgi:hypothetical protein
MVQTNRSNVVSKRSDTLSLLFRFVQVGYGKLQIFMYARTKAIRKPIDRPKIAMTKHAARRVITERHV